MWIQILMSGMSNEMYMTVQNQSSVCITDLSFVRWQLFHAAIDAYINKCFCDLL